MLGGSAQFLWGFSITVQTDTAYQQQLLEHCTDRNMGGGETIARAEDRAEVATGEPARSGTEASLPNVAL